MEVITSITDLRRARTRHGSRSCGFVPTMGCLHIGHLALIDRARGENDLTGVSIFVNPAQFGPQEDYTRYPRTFADDCAHCEQHGVDFIFAPDAAEMYRPGAATMIEAGPLGERLEGAFRPGHFRGVATIVAKLFNLFRPERAYFGEKDAQQLAVIEQLARDLDFPVSVVPCPTVREKDGLAFSSRNRYLTAEQRTQAPKLFLTLQQVSAMLKSGCARAAAETAGLQVLAAAGFGPVDYLAAVDPVAFLPADRGPRRLVVAARLGATRLIDNLLVD